MNMLLLALTKRKTHIPGSATSVRSKLLGNCSHSRRIGQDLVEDAHLTFCVDQKLFTIEVGLG